MATKIISSRMLILIAIFCVLNMADYVLTYIGISSGMCREANPILSWLPLEGIGLVKTGACMAIIYRSWNKPANIILCICIMALVVIWNIYTIGVGL